MAFSREDSRWMAQALALAARAEGSTAPNPKVGCVVVREGRAIGAGLHHGAGTAHAEDLALDAAGSAARDATVYVTLEPCAHHGRTPPCVERLIAARVGRVVAAMRDPDPRVDGKGFAELENAGIQVECGLLAREAQRLNAVFVHHHRSGIPLVTLKAALSLDGQIAAAQGESRWISGAPARRVAHRMRLDHDAVLIGAGTLRRDDPRLSIRLDGSDRHGVVAVVSSSLDLSPDARVFAHRTADQVLVYTGPLGSTPASGALQAVATIVRVAADGAGLVLEEVLRDLSGRGVHSVLVEGGGMTLHRFLRCGLAHRAALFHAPLALGAQGATPLLDGASVDEPSAGWSLEREGVVALGRDQLTIGRWIPAQIGSS
jgi:diaminohydroxyphosphoribosylaminopyrimidine deaminase/5-amino-6-(5-phosphoribosylamino)uracil reductase